MLLSFKMLMKLHRVVAQLLKPGSSSQRFHPWLRSCSTTSDFRSREGSDDNSGKMSGWQIHEYGGVEILQCSDNIKVPTISSPNEVCIEIHTASVNPIDVAMMGGYGATLLNVLRCNNNIEFPLTLGRDFCGVVVRKGMAVREELQVGDKVWGVVPLHRSGCHAEYVVVDESCVSHKPEGLDDIEAAGTLYAGLTAWSGLFVSAHMGGICGALTSQGGGQGKRVCILGASGGVGSIATQIAKAENLVVVATCSDDAAQMVKNFGADHIINYKANDAIQLMRDLGPYDIILDCAGQGVEYATKVPWKFDQYVTFSSPMLRNIDSNGLGIGFFKNIVSLLESNVQTLSKYRALSKWAYFVPAPQGIEYLKKQVERNKITPVVDSVFDFDSTSDAYQKVADGHLRGKVILRIK